MFRASFWFPIFVIRGAEDLRLREVSRALDSQRRGVVTSRRDFLERTALAAVGLALPASWVEPSDFVVTPPGFLDVRRSPDALAVETSSANVHMNRATNGRWESGPIIVTTTEHSDSLGVQLAAPGVAVKRLHLRWHGRLSEVGLILGDAWERGYGYLEWRGWVPDRVMPWYVAMQAGTLTHAYGVRTGASAFCFWQADPDGISLSADVRSGGIGVELGPRMLDVCNVICRPGRASESAFHALHSFCREMCPNPRLPSVPVYGSNDWYWAYGKNSAETVIADARRMAELAPPGANRPFVVIDDGWQPGRGADKAGAGTWDRGNEKFPDMPGLSAEIHQTSGRPGIWIRPLQAPADAPDGWRLARDRKVLDPTVPDVREKIRDDIRRITQWGFELIKHDYSTFDIFGRWGFQMASTLTSDGWSFASGPNRTTAEVIDDLYATIREAAGDAVVIGCNTVSHLSAGHFELCRIGDDTSGAEWSRTRKMGVNSLAFRGVQHGGFYVADADCVAVTNGLPWSLEQQWLDLVSRSGTTLFVSLAPDAIGPDQRRDLKAALALAAAPQPLGEPLDWQHNVCPSAWRLIGRDRKYDWTADAG